MAPKKGAKRVPKVRPPLDFGDITVSRVTDRRTMADMRRTRGDRDPQQLQVDAIVDAAYNEWLEAGKPTAWVDQPGTFLSVPQDQAETLQWRVRQAGTHYALRIRFGDIKITDGYAEVVFTATDRPAKSDDAQDGAQDDAQDGAQDGAGGSDGTGDTES